MEQENRKGKGIWKPSEEKNQFTGFTIKMSQDNAEMATIDTRPTVKYSQSSEDDEIKLLKSLMREMKKENSKYLSQCWIYQERGINNCIQIVKNRIKKLKEGK